MSPRSVRARSVHVAIVGLIVLGPSGPSQAASRRTFELSLFDAGAVERARQGAVRRLGDAECRKVLSDFTDSAGRPLTARLDQWGVLASEYLLMIPFLNGEGSRRCRTGGPVLVTTAGVPRVFVCSSFAMLQFHDPGTAEAMVIHEMLHTLGLGEDPPSSIEITQRVKGRCG